MEIIIHTTDNNIRVEMCGRIDTASSATCEQELQPVFSQADKHIELDCAQLTYISSSGLRLFLSLLKRVQASKGTLKVTHLNNDIYEVFRMTGFSKLFYIEA